MWRALTRELRRGGAPCALTRRRRNSEDALPLEIVRVHLPADQRPRRSLFSLSLCCYACTPLRTRARQSYSICTLSSCCGHTFPFVTACTFLVVSSIKLSPCLAESACAGLRRVRRVQPRMAAEARCRNSTFAFMHQQKAGGMSVRAIMGAIVASHPRRLRLQESPARFGECPCTEPAERIEVSSCGSGFLFICRPKLALTGVGQPGGRAGV